MKQFLNLIFPAIFLLMTAGIPGLRAQGNDTLWTLRLGGPSYQDNLSYALQADDNNYYAGGIIFTESTQTDIWVIKYTVDGTVIWNNSFQTDTLQPYLSESLRGMFPASGGGIVVLAANNYFEHFLINIDEGGNVSKIKRYLGSEDPYYVYCSTPSADNGFIVAGDHAVLLGNDWYHYSWYRKIDTDGTMLWEQSYPCLTWQDRFLCMKEINGGDFILAGTTDTEDSNSDLLIFRITAQGDTVWTKRWGTSAFDYPHEISPTNDGGFIIGGTTSYLSSYDGFLLKLDGDGNEVWTQEYNSYSDDEIHSVKSTTDGGFIITGKYNPGGNGPGDFWIMKTDAQGNEVSSFHFGGETSPGYGNCVIPSNEGGYMAVGKSMDDGIMVKVSPDFGLFGIEDRLMGDFNLMPNPGFGKFQISSDKFQTNPAFQIQNRYVEVVDLYGKIIVKKGFEPGSGNLEIDISYLPAGIYFIRLNVEDQMIVKKIIKI